MIKTAEALILFLSLLFFVPSSAFSQEEEDFQRLARRSIDNYEAEVKKQQPDYDSVAWHGAAYIGTSSRGHILPNGFFNYKRGKLQMAGNVEMDFSQINTSRSVEGIHGNGDHQLTDTKIANRYEHEDLTFRIDYHLDKQNVLSFDFFQKYYADRVGETATRHNRAKDGSENNKFEDQQRKEWKINCGSLVEYLHQFGFGGSFSARAYIKYDNTPTDINSVVWGKEMVYEEKDDHKAHHSTDTKGQLLFHSPKWGGFSFSLREKIGFMSTRISDAISLFDYHVTQVLTSGALNYNVGRFSFVAEGGYESYHHKLETLSDNTKGDVMNTYRDFLYNLSATWKINARNKFTASYKHSINRPTYTQLYPFVHVGSNIGSRVKGNEDLQPSVTNQVQGKYTFSVQSLTLSTSVTYQKKSDDITGIATYDEEEQVNVKTWINDAEYNTVRGALEGEMRAGKFGMTFGARVQRLWYDGETVSEDKAWSYSFKIRPQLKLPNEWMLSAVSLYNGRESHLHWYSNPFTYLAFRAQKQLGDWAVYGFVQDILNEDRVKSENSNNNVLVTSNDYNARALIIGCSYRF